MAETPDSVPGAKRKALFIDSAMRSVTEVEIGGLEDMQRLVGGYIETAVAWANGDMLFVDEEGLLKPQEHFFRLPVERPDQPFAGNGILVGREEEGPQFEDGYTTHPPTTTADELRAKVIFLTALEARAT